MAPHPPPPSAAATGHRPRKANGGPLPSLEAPVVVPTTPSSPAGGHASLESVFRKLTRFEGEPKAFLQAWLALLRTLTQATELRLLTERDGTWTTFLPEAPSAEAPSGVSDTTKVWELAAEACPAAAQSGKPAARLLCEVQPVALLLQPLNGGPALDLEPEPVAATMDRLVLGVLLPTHDPRVTAWVRERMMLAVQLWPAYLGRRAAARAAAAVQADRLTHRLASMPDLVTAGTELCNQASLSLPADRVYLGRVRGASSVCVAVSQGADFDRSTRTVRNVERAMSEAMEAAVLRTPIPEDLSLRLHDQEGRVLDAVVLPQPGGGGGSHQAAGFVLIAEREPAADGRPLPEPPAAWVRLVGRSAAALSDRAQGDRWVDGRLVRAVASGWASVLGPAHGRVKASLLGVAAAAAVVAWVPMRDQVAAPFVAEPVHQRVASAPFDGVLDTVHVQPGDAVVAGQTLLASLRTDELRLERAGLIAEATGHQREADLHRDTDPAAARLARLEVERLEARVALLDHRLAEARIIASVTGRVLDGDLEQRIGAPVRAGDTLMTLGRADRLRAVLRVPESQVGRVKLGDAVRVHSAAAPGRPLQARIVRIHPSAEVVGDRNVFRVEAELAETVQGSTGTATSAGASLRPGTQGRAVVASGHSPLLHQWLRPIRHWWALRS